MLECDLYYHKEMLEMLMAGKGDCSILVSPYNPRTMDGTVIRVNGDRAEELILGKWKLDTISATYEGSSFEMTVADLAALIGADDEFTDFIVEFKDNGYVYMEDESAAYSIDGDKLTVTQDGESIEMTISKISSSSLILEAEEDGVVMNLTFKKA